MNDINYNVLKTSAEDTNKIGISKVYEDVLLDNLGEGVIAVDKDDRIIFMNIKAKKMLGLNSDEVIGKSYSHTLIMEDESGAKIPEENRQMVFIPSTAKRVNTNDSYYYVRKDGTRFPVSATVSLIILNSEIMGAINVFRDITKEKDLDQAKSDFISLASHQLRTPISSTKWVLEILMQDEGLTDKQKEWLNDLYIANERLIDLVNNLLNAGRIEQRKLMAEKVLINLRTNVEQLCEARKLRVEKNKQKLETSFIGDMGNIDADKMLFGETFGNLLDNAIDYSTPGSTITIIVRLEGKEYILSIHNEGTSIPQEYQDKLFTKFYRTPEARNVKASGSGLGLYIAKAAVEANGGKIWFESSRDMGTTFYFTVPVI